MGPLTELRSPASETLCRPRGWKSVPRWPKCCLSAFSHLLLFQKHRGQWGKNILQVGPLVHAAIQQQRHPSASRCPGCPCQDEELATIWTEVVTIPYGPHGCTHGPRPDMAAPHLRSSSQWRASQWAFAELRAHQDPWALKWQSRDEVGKFGHVRLNQQPLEHPTSPRLYGQLVQEKFFQSTHPTSHSPNISTLNPKP